MKRGARARRVAHRAGRPLVIEQSRRVTPRVALQSGERKPWHKKKKSGERKPWHQKKPPGKSNFQTVLVFACADLYGSREAMQAVLDFTLCFVISNAGQVPAQPEGEKRRRVLVQDHTQGNLLPSGI